MFALNDVSSYFKDYRHGWVFPKLRWLPVVHIPRAFSCIAKLHFHFSSDEVNYILFYLQSMDIFPMV